MTVICALNVPFEAAHAATETCRARTSLAQAPQANKGPDLNQLMAEGQFVEAAAILDTVLSVSPLDSKAWFNLGICRQAMNDFHGALAAYEMNCALNPDDSEAKCAAESIKRFITKQSEDKAAKEAREQAYKNRRANLAKLVRENKYEEVIPQINSELRETPADVEMWYALGLCKQGVKDYHGALAAFEMASRLLPGHEHIERERKAVSDFLHGVTSTPPQHPTKPE